MKQIKFTLLIIFLCHTLYGQTTLTMPGQTISQIADTQPLEDFEVYVYDPPLSITRFSDFSPTEEEWVIQQTLAAKVKSDMDSFIIFPEEYRYKRDTYMPLAIPFEYVDQVYDHLSAEATHKVKFVQDGKLNMMIQQKLFYKDSLVALITQHMVKENNVWKATLFPVNRELSSLVRMLKSEFLYDILLQKKGHKLVNQLIEDGTTAPNGHLNIDRINSLIRNEVDKFEPIRTNVRSFLWYENFVKEE